MLCKSHQELVDLLNQADPPVSLPDTDALADLLIEELNALPGDLILVLDHYHHIRTPDARRKTHLLKWRCRLVFRLAL